MTSAAAMLIISQRARRTKRGLRLAGRLAASEARPPLAGDLIARCLNGLPTLVDKHGQEDENSSSVVRLEAEEDEVTVR